MAWGTSFNTDIEIYRETFQNIEHLESKIEECDETISSVKTKLLLYSATTPKDIFVLEEGENIIDKVNFVINELLQIYNDELILCFKLKLLKENFDKRENF